MKTNRFVALPLAVLTLGAVGLGLTGCSASNSQGSGKDVINSFMQDVSTKDTTLLSALYGGMDRNAEAKKLGKELAKTVAFSNAKVSDWSITEYKVTSDTTAEAEVTYKLNDKKDTVEVGVIQDEADNKWYINDDNNDYRNLGSYTTPSFNDVDTAGKTYIVSNGKRQLYKGEPLLPGKYSFTTTSKRGFFTPVKETVSFDIHGAQSGAKATGGVLSSVAKKHYGDMVLSYLNTCNNAIYPHVTDSYQGNVPAKTADCPVWASTAKYNLDNSSYYSDSTTNITPSYESEYQNHEKFKMIAAPTIASVSYDDSGKGIVVKLTGGSYELWTYQSDFNVQYDASGGSAGYTYKWSKPHTFDDADVSTYATNGYSDYSPDQLDTLVPQLNLELDK
jgi:hypothetical protein